MKRYAAAAVLWGIAVGAVAYRYGVLPFMWSSPWKHVLPGLAIGLVFAGRALTRDAENSRADGRDDVRPAIPLLVAVGLAGAALAFGLSYLAFPTLNRLSLEKRNLPGFALSLPSGTVVGESRDYASGKLTLKDVGGVRGVVIVAWEVGEVASADHLKLAGELMVKSIDASARSSLTKAKGPGLVPVDTMRFTGDFDMLMSALPCGSRQVYVATGGSSAPFDLHERILQSFACTPDPAHEGSAKLTSPIAIDLPGWYLAADEPDQIQITDGLNALFIRRQDANLKKIDLAGLVEPMFKAAGVDGKVTSRDGDRVNFTMSADGEKMDGWARLVPCPDATAFVMALGTSKDNLDFLYKRVSAARCLRNGEPAQQWPSPPATLQQ